MDVNTILWPTDLSKSSIQAAQHVVDLAEKHGAGVVVLYVGIDLCEYFPAYGNYPSKDELQSFQSWEIEQAKKDLEAVCEKELKACPNWEVKLVQGDAVGKILEFVKSENADLVVLTSRGHGSENRPDKGTGLGSVAREVVERSPVPVHVVKA
jgi:nucleotide-binding universal stress UspA family protein